MMGIVGNRQNNNALGKLISFYFVLQATFCIFAMYLLIPIRNTLTTMRKIILVLLSICLLTGCAGSNNLGQLSRKERKLQKQMHIRQELADRHYTISVRSAHPLGRPTIMLSTPYSLEVRGDSLISYLPYFGTAYNVPYGGGKALNFTGIINEYEDVEVKPGEHHIGIGIRNEEDSYIYNLVVFESGSSSIYVYMRQRSEISFNGEVVE